MFDILLRALKDHLTQPLSRLVPAAISPNHLTLAAFLAGLSACYFAAVPHPAHPPHLPVALWLLNRVLDCLDGSVARLRGSATETGSFLDLLSDFVVYSLIPLSVACGLDNDGGDNGGGDGGVGGRGKWQAVAVLEATFHVNNFVLFYIAAVAAKKRSGELTSVTMAPALVEGFESGILFTIMLLWPEWIVQVAWAMSAAVTMGIVQRVMILLPVLERLDKGGEGKEVEAIT